MNLKQAEIILEKITRLYKSMKLDERNIDAFEQDLMLSYIRQLYESFTPDQPVSKRVKPVLPPIEEPPKAVVKETPKPVAPKPAPPKPEPPKAVETPVVKEPPVVVETPTPSPPPAPPKPPTPAPKPQVAKASAGLSAPDRAALFEFKEATELSEKLSMQPIRDLTKAMGLNEKIFTINELFGGDSKVFDETLRKLNTFTSFTEAADYLASGVAHTYGWPKRSSKKKALNFIQLVKRRYN